MSINQGVIKSCIFTLMTLILVLALSCSINAVCINWNQSNYPRFYEDFPPWVWLCDNEVISNNSSIERINNSFFEEDKIQWKTLVLNKRGINKIQNIFGLAENKQGFRININCAPDLISNSEGVIYASCNAKIMEEQITTFNPSTMSYYLCNLAVESSKTMQGEYWLTVEAVDINDVSGTALENKYFILNSMPIYPNPKIALSFDPKTNELVLTPDENSSIKDYSKKCLNKQCIRKIERYLITNVYNQNLILELRDTKSKNQNTIEILSLTYNNNKTLLKSNKFIIKDLNNEINEEVTYNQTRTNIVYNKKKNESKISILDKDKRVNKKENGFSLININIIDGNLNYEVIKTNQTNISNNKKSNPKIIGCDWRPYKGPSGCYEIFGESGKGCSSGDAELGYYFNGKKCVSVSGFGLLLNKRLFLNLRECEELCL